jgi:hypothetical protein
MRFIFMLFLMIGVSGCEIKCSSEETPRSVSTSAIIQECDVSVSGDLCILCMHEMDNDIICIPTHTLRSIESVKRDSRRVSCVYQAHTTESWRRWYTNESPEQLIECLEECPKPGKIEAK